mgnify:CR=1 FL=1
MLRAEADSAKAKAEGEASATRLRADAALYETERAAEGQMKLIGAVGRENVPSYWFNQRWNGIMPSVVGGTNVSVTDIPATVAPRVVGPR